MFCTKCGEALPPKSNFCGKCGSPVAQTEAGDAKAKEIENRKTSSLIKIWLLPFAALFIVAFGMLADYLYQNWVNQKVEALRISGEKLALEGKVAEGKAKIDQALALRPQLAILRNDEKLLEEALRVEQKINEAQTLTKQQKFADALLKVEQAQKELNGRSGPLYTVMMKQAKKQEEQTTLAQVRHDIPKKKGIEELAALLTKVSAFQGEEAAKTKKVITQKMADVAYAEAEKALKKKDFAQAMETIENVLTYDQQNKKLLSFQKTIKQKQKSFEQAEQKRLEMAMEAAAKEEMKNRTQAVDLVSLTSGVNESGNFVISGEVRNVATRPISFIRLYYSIFDANGNIVGESSTYVSPYYLDIGEAGYFEAIHYDDGLMNSVQITRVEWALN
jgi:hypothetical protein